MRASCGPSSSIETLKHVECFDKCRPLRPKTGLVHFITAIISFDWLAHLRREFCEIVCGDQSAVGLHVRTDTTRNWTTIKIITRGHQTGVTIIPHTSGGGAFGLNYPAQRARQIRLHEDL